MEPITDPEFITAIKSIPSPEEFRTDLQDLFSKSDALKDLPSIRAAYFEKAKILPNTVAQLSPEDINLLTAFRVRAKIQTEEDLSLIRTFSYPSTDACRYNGRANIKNHPVFYCADNPITAIMESKLALGDTAFISVWRVRFTGSVQYAGYLPVNLPAKNPWFNTATIQFDKIKNHIQSIQSGKDEQLKILFEFLFQIFVTETEPYSLTSWLSHRMLYNFGIQFIVYPSFQTKSWQCNMAFHPNVVDLFFSFHRVFEFKMSRIDEDGGKFTISKMGRMKSTGIIWTEAPEDEVQHFFPGAER
jgi:hypothetical protein